MQTIDDFDSFQNLQICFLILYFGSKGKWNIEVLLIYFEVIISVFQKYIYTWPSHKY